MPDFQIGSISFEEDGVAIQYVSKTDVRKDGALQMMQTMFIGAHPDYRDGLDDLVGKAEALLKDALEDYATAEVVDLAQDDESDDDLGMGYG